jgi:hypothetical protein
VEEKEVADAKYDTVFQIGLDTFSLTAGKRGSRQIGYQFVGDNLPGEDAE